MPIPVNCPFCGGAFQSEPGQSASCPMCGGVFVPGGGARPPAPMPMGAADEMPCPMCGESIKVNARICRYCKAQTGGAGPAPAPSAPYAYGGYAAPPPKKKSSCLMWSLIIGGILALCCGGPVVGFFVGRGALAKATCEETMRKLSADVRDMNEAGPERAKRLDTLRGSELWREQAKKRGDESPYVCAGAMFNEFQMILFLGPKRAYSEVGPEDPVGACPRSGHKDGAYIMYKNGRHKWVSKEDPEYERAYSHLQ